MYVVRQTKFPAPCTLYIICDDRQIYIFTKCVMLMLTLKHTEFNYFTEMTKAIRNESYSKQTDWKSKTIIYETFVHTTKHYKLRLIAVKNL